MQKILISSQSHVAVDHALDKIKETDTRDKDDSSRDT